MVTLINTQDDFIKALKELLELEYNSMELYEAVINRLQNEIYKNKIIEFKRDHENHIQDISRILESNNVDFIKGPSGMQLLLIGRVAINKIIGDDIDVLKVMIGAEDDNIKAYQRMLQYDNQPGSATEMAFQKGLSDETKHRDWILSVTDNL